MFLTLKKKAKELEH